MTENRHTRRDVARGRSRAVLARNLPFSFWPMAFLGVLALLIQSFVVQTHIHIPQAAGRTQTVSLFTLAAAAIADRDGVATDDAANAPRDKYPINEDPTNCPLCQEISHSGQFITSASIVAALPVTFSVNLIPWSEAAIATFAVTHIWRSRAPPANSGISSR